MRKIFIGTALGSIAVATVLLGAPAAMAQTYFPITCQTGGAMKLILSPNLRRDTTRFEIRFRKARAAARTARPLPGECAWFDRPVNSLEPTLIWLTLRATVWTEFRVRGSGWTSTGVVANGDAQRGFAEEFLRRVRGTGCFVLNVRNSNRGYLEAQTTIQAGC